MELTVSTYTEVKVSVGLAYICGKHGSCGDTSFAKVKYSIGGCPIAKVYFDVLKVKSLLIQNRL